MCQFLNGLGFPIPLSLLYHNTYYFPFSGYRSRKSTRLGVRETGYKSLFCHKWLYGLGKCFHFSGLKNEGVGPVGCSVIFFFPFYHSAKMDF